MRSETRHEKAARTPDTTSQIQGEIAGSWLHTERRAEARGIVHDSKDFSPGNIKFGIAVTDVRRSGGVGSWSFCGVSGISKPTGLAEVRGLDWSLGTETAVQTRLQWQWDGGLRGVGTGGGKSSARLP